jgi:hypothetical protein
MIASLSVIVIDEAPLHILGNQTSGRRVTKTRMTVALRRDARRHLADDVESTLQQPHTLFLSGEPLGWFCADVTRAGMNATTSRLTATAADAASEFSNAIQLLVVEFL